MKLFTSSKITSHNVESIELVDPKRSNRPWDYELHLILINFIFILTKFMNMMILCIIKIIVLLNVNEIDCFGFLIEFRFHILVYLSVYSQFIVHTCVHKKLNIKWISVRIPSTNTRTHTTCVEILPKRKSLFVTLKN